MHRLHICVKNSYVDFEHFNFLPVRAKKHLEMVKYITERDLDRGHLWTWTTKGPMDHKTSHKGKFFEIEIYSSSESGMHKLSIDSLMYGLLG